MASSKREKRASEPAGRAAEGAHERPANEVPRIVSIHDVMPETMDRIERLLELLRARSIPPVTLLVVPGRDWTEAGIRRLRELADGGHELAAHGWRHHVERIRGIRHRLHSRFISRRVAEHLALDADGILDLLRRSHAWFADHALPAPRLYVPPAWALGPIPRARLREAPFAMIESARGFLDLTGEPTLYPAPVIGFEADTRLRASALRLWNRRQTRNARRTGRPLRVSIHPDDPDLRLREDLFRALDSGQRFLDAP